MSQSKVVSVYQWAQIIIAAGTLLGGAGLLYKWISTPSRDVTAYVHTYEFGLPYAAQVAAALSGDQTAEARLLRSLSNARYLYRIDIQNVSQQTIRNLNIELDGGIAHSTVRNVARAPIGSDLSLASRGGRLDIPTLRPEERVTAYIWASNLIFNSSFDASKLLVTWENGSAEKVFVEYNTPFYRWLDGNMPWLIPLVFIPMTVVAFIFLVAVLEALLKKARSHSGEVAPPPGNTLPLSAPPSPPSAITAARPNQPGGGAQ